MFTADESKSASTFTVDSRTPSIRRWWLLSASTELLVRTTNPPVKTEKNQGICVASAYTHCSNVRRNLNNLRQGIQNSSGRCGLRPQ